MNIHGQRTVKSGAQKRREKKLLATLQKAVAQSYSLAKYFLCTSEHGQCQEMLMTKLMRMMPKVL